jgi:hypothetical protein
VTSGGKMGNVAGFIGDLLCKMPLGIDRPDGRAELGSGGIFALLGVVALFFQMRYPRRKRSRRW